MKMQTVKYLVIYLFIVCTAFIAAHFLIISQPPNTSRGFQINGFKVLLSLLAYVVYFFVTPYFFQKIAVVSYGKGLLFMCLGMIIAGFFIWLAFGDGDYSADFYKYEFVSAGLWFCLFNAGFMSLIHVRKSFQAQHKSGVDQ